VEKQGGRLAGVSGILFVVVVYAGVILGDTGILGGLPEPPPGAGGEEWVAYYTSSHAALLLPNCLGSLAFCFFLIFVGGLCNAVWGPQEERRLPMLGLVAFGGGVKATALQLASTAVSWAAVSSAQTKVLDPQIAGVLREVDTILLVSAYFPLAILLGATALGVLLTHALPRWLGWAAGVLAIVLLGTTLLIAASPDSEVWVYDYMLIALWTIITSIILMRGARRGRPNRFARVR